MQMLCGEDSARRNARSKIQTRGSGKVKCRLSACEMPLERWCSPAIRLNRISVENSFRCREHCGSNSGVQCAGVWNPYLLLSLHLGDPDNPIETLVTAFSMSPLA